MKLPGGRYPFIDERLPLSEMAMVDAPPDLEALFKDQAATDNGYKAQDNQFAVGPVGQAPTYLGHDYQWWRAHPNEPILYRPMAEWIADYVRAEQGLNNQVQAAKVYNSDNPNLKPIINNDPDYEKKVALKKELLQRIADHNAEVEKKMMESLDSKKPSN